MKSYITAHLDRSERFTVEFVKSFVILDFGSSRQLALYFDDQYHIEHFAHQILSQLDRIRSEQAAANNEASLVTGAAE